MPKEEKMVDLDTSGEGAEVNIEEQKDESVVNTEAPKEGLEAVETKQEEVKEEPKEELKEGTKPEEKKDNELEDYSKGVQARIAKLTRKMREAERREKPLWIMQKQLKAKDSLWILGLVKSIKIM